MRRVRTHLSYANVMATVAVFIALGGTSYAVTQLPRNSVGSKQIRTRRRRSVGAAHGRRALAGHPRPLGRAQGHLDGRAAVAPRPDGRDRPAGPARPGGGDARGCGDGRGDGSPAVRGPPAGATTHSIASGVYKIDFNRDISTCYVLATIATTRGNATGGEITSEIGADARSVTVRTGDSNGAAADLPFHVIVTC